MSDLDYLFNMLRSHWPDFQVRRQNFTSPTPEYVQSFYNEVYNEFKRRLIYILNGEPFYDEFDNVVEQGYDPEVQLYCRIAKLFHKLKSTTLTLNDIYQPVPKRTTACARLAMHFLVYIANLEEHSSVLVSESLTKQQQVKSLDCEKQDLMQEIYSHVENIPKNEADLEKLTRQLKTVNKEYEKMLDEKMLKDKLLTAQNSELEKLQLECENLEYDLKQYEQSTEKLQEELVTDEEFDNIKKLLKSLDSDLEKLSTDDFDFDKGLNDQRETLSQLEETIKLLATINFDVLNLKELTQCEEQLKLAKEDQGKMMEKLSGTKATIAVLENRLITLKNDLNNYMQQLEQLKEMNQSEIERMNQLITVQYGNVSQARKQEQTLNDKINQLKDQIENYESDEAMLKKSLEERYNKCCVNLNTALSKLKEFLTQVKEKGNNL